MVFKILGVKPEKLDYTSNFTIGIKFNIPENFTKIPIVLNYTIYPVNQVWGHLHVLWRSSDYIPRYSIPFLHNVIEIQRAIDVSYMELQNVHAPKVKF